MQPEKQNGSNAAQQLNVPEGDRYLFVRMSESGEFQILFSDMAAAIMLNRVADAYLETEIKKAFNLLPPAQHASSITGVALDPRVMERLKSRGMKG